jgi:putative flippase GtrA
MPAPALARQVASFFGVGVLAVIVHYAVLVGLVEGAGAAPVASAGAGYLAGGLASYLLNRTHTFASDRPHREASWRFAAVMAVGFALTLGLMAILVGRLGLPYLPSQIAATGVVFAWNFAAHRWWTFRAGSGAAG